MSTNDNDRCLFCDSTESLEEHHVVPRKYGGTNDPENLITVCSDCHKTIERVWGHRFYRAIGIRSDHTPTQLYDALKELRWTLLQTKAAVEGAYAHYDEQLDYCADVTVDDYGGSVTRRQVVAIKREAYKELLDGEVLQGLLSLDELEDLEGRTYRLLDELEDLES